MDQQQRDCAKCGEFSAGVGGVLCPACLARLAAQARDYWSTTVQEPAAAAGDQ